MGAVIFHLRTRDEMYQLNVHKSRGPDRIQPAVILKKLVGIMAGPLLTYPRSWEPGEVPTAWNVASVTEVTRRACGKTQGTTAL